MTRSLKKRINPIKCNPRSPKAQDPRYTCNPRTGRWKLKLAKSFKKSPNSKGSISPRKCNPRSPKAQDPRYICNPHTARWNLKSRKLSTSPKFITPVTPKRFKTPEQQNHYFQFSSGMPTRNYKCLGDYKGLESILRNCPRQISDITIENKIIGKGSYGKVYKGTGYVDGKKIPVSVKVIRDTDIEDVYKEVEMSYYMGEFGSDSVYNNNESVLGPKVYDAFFREEPDGTFTQYIIMEYFDTNLCDLLESKKYDKGKLHSNVLRAIQYMVYYSGVECYDIKPDNFVYRYSDGAVRIIDFGIPFCGVTNVTEEDFKNRKDYYEDRKILYHIVTLIFMYIAAEECGDSFFSFLSDSYDENGIPTSYLLDGPHTNKEKMKHLRKIYLFIKKREALHNMIYIYTGIDITSQEGVKKFIRLAIYGK